ncbi:MAG TPA: NADH-ubiquinone oxidoreductase-F iron-sulfur binding region domain-containing protein [Gaiellaceae bacterium]
MSSTRLLAGVSGGLSPALANHDALFGPLQANDDLIAAVDRAGLRGRGGAAFPTATKLSAVAGAGGRPIVVANAVEGEPVSGKDRALLRVAPHLVLDGMVAAGRAVGAREGIVALSRAARRERAVVEEAIAQRGGRDGATRLRTATVPDRFVAGEETALVNALSRRDAMPSLKPPFPSEQGVDGAPTLVSNAETLAHVALIARYGPGWFRDAGRPDAPGTAMVTLGGAVSRPGVYEIELGTRLVDVVARAGNPTKAVQGVLVGGLFGRWVSPEAAAGLELTPDVLGAGAIVVLPTDACAVAECARVLSYLAGESAGQCGPCVHGLRAIADVMHESRTADRGARLEELAAQVIRRGACRHPDGAVGFLSSALDVLAEDFALHARRGTCGRSDGRVLAVPSRSRR